MSYGILILLIAGATWRVTRFIIKDTILDAPRKWVKRKAKANLSRRMWHKLDDLLVCPWCVSIYIAAATCAAADLRYSLPAPLFVWLTASALTGIVIMNEPPHQIQYVVEAPDDDEDE